MAGTNLIDVTDITSFPGQPNRLAIHIRPGARLKRKGDFSSTLAPLGQSDELTLDYGRTVPVVFGVILFAALVLQFLPALAMLTGGHHNNVASIVQVVERVARLGADAVHVAFAFEGQQVRL